VDADVTAILEADMTFELQAHFVIVLAQLTQKTAISA
jgi:hypothetical protein